MIPSAARSRASSASDSPAPGPEVSVLMIAYNVERYIAQAVDSVLSQQLDFEYELVVGEDCSTDRTRDILVEYQERHPGRIRVLAREHNLGMNKNFVSTLEACRGAYIALLDSDDYWLSPVKLQRQVTMLRDDPRLAMAFHNTLVVYDDDQTEAHPFHVPRPRKVHERTIPARESTLDDLITGNFLQTGSVVFRSGACRELRQWIAHFPTFDWPLHLLNARHGSIGYINEVLGVYRVRRDGVWSMNMSRYDRIEDVAKFLEAYEFLKTRFGDRFPRQISERLASFHFRLAVLQAQAGEREAAVAHARTALAVLPLQHRFTRKYLGRQKLLVEILLRSRYRALRRRLTGASGSDGGARR